MNRLRDPRRPPPVNARRLAAVAVAAALALECAACGGSGGKATSPPPATSTTTTTAAVDLADGKAIFSSTCAGCHTLAAAGASGTVGPSLDKGDHSVAFILDRVTNGNTDNLGVMPAFVGSLTAQQIQDVAAFVSRSAGK